MKCPACGAGNGSFDSICEGCRKPLEGRAASGFFGKRKIFFYRVIGLVPAVLLTAFLAVCFWMMRR